MSTKQSAPAGWQLVRVNDAFNDLINALERADRKGYLAESLIEPWEAFDYEYVAAAPKAEPQPSDDAKDALVDALEDILSGWIYIRQQHGDLYGVGWGRAQGKAEKALAAYRAAMGSKGE